MNLTRILRTSWTPRSILLVAFIGCILFASTANASSESLAKNWQSVKGSLPHDKIPSDPNKIQDTNSWAMAYAVSLGKVVGLGFVIAFLSILAGLIYGIIKILRMCCRKLCCSSDDEEEGSDEKEDPDEYTSFKRHWCPTLVYAVAWIFLLVGMCYGLANNPRFSQGVNDMGDSVISVGTNAVSLGNGLLTSVNDIVALIPVTIDGIQDQFAGVNPLADSVELLSDNVNSTSSQVSNITDSIAKIDAGNTSSVAQLYAKLSSINNQSVSIISTVSKLTDEVANNLKTTYNSTIGSLDDKVDEIDGTVDGLQDTAKGIIKQAQDLVDKVIEYVNDGKGYDKSRAKGVTALFVLVILVTAAIVIAFIVKIKAIFNAIAAFSFVFLFFLWLSGAIHFMLGMVLYDACPIIDVTVQGMLPKGSQAATVLQGCLYEHRTVLQSMNITAYNLTEVFDYRGDFQKFQGQTFNFSQIDGYFDSIQSLYTYNLTQMADNLTVANFGWNQSYIYTALDGLNNLTSPDYYDLSNYTQADPSQYSPPKDKAVNDSMTSITTLLALNQTIYNKTAVAKQQLYEAQGSINNLLSSMNALETRFDGIKANVNVLQTTNISNCIGTLDNLQSNITGFFTLGNCSFLGESYIEIKDGLCETMQPAIDCLTAGQFLAGLALIPILIIAEVLSFRYPKSTFVNPFGGQDDDNYDAESQKSSKDKSGKGGYAIAMTDSPVPRRSAITATIGTAPPTASAESSPDFNANRRTIHEHLTNRDSL